MCIMLAVLPNLKIDKATFNRCWDKNPDGFGMSYLFGGQIRVKKTMEKHTAWNIYNSVHNLVPESAKILHFRIGTHGVKDITNCHPFYVNSELVFAHNGMINAVPMCPDKLLSDTQMFNNLVLKNLPADFYKWECYHMLIEQFIGYSKLLFLDLNNEIFIMNENKGTWHDGVWFSNDGFKEPVKHNVVPFKADTYRKPEQTNKYDERLPYTEMIKKYKTADEMTDAEFSAFSESGRRPLRTDYPYKETWEECIYCGLYKPRGRYFDTIGCLCAKCIDELSSMGIELKGKSVDDIVESMFNQDKKEEQPKTIIESLSDMDYENYYKYGCCY